MAYVAIDQGLTDTNQAQISYFFNDFDGNPDG